MLLHCPSLALRVAAFHVVLCNFEKAIFGVLVMLVKLVELHECNWEKVHIFGWLAAVVMPENKVPTYSGTSSDTMSITDVI